MVEVQGTDFDQVDHGGLFCGIVADICVGLEPFQGVFFMVISSALFGSTRVGGRTTYGRGGWEESRLRREGVSHRCITLPSPQGPGVGDPEFGDPDLVSQVLFDLFIVHLTYLIL